MSCFRKSPFCIEAHEIRPIMMIMHSMSRLAIIRPFRLRCALRSLGGEWFSVRVFSHKLKNPLDLCVPSGLQKEVMKKNDTWPLEQPDQFSLLQYVFFSVKINYFTYFHFFT